MARYRTQMDATLAGSMASRRPFGQRSDDDMDADEFLQRILPGLTPDPLTSYPPGFLEPQMAQELLKGMSSDICHLQFAIDTKRVLIES